MAKAILWGMAVLSAVTFLVCGWDKRQAIRRRHRVPEKTLFLLSACGGAGGMLVGMFWFHHKTRHPAFFLGIPLLLIAEAVLYFLLFL